MRVQGEVEPEVAGRNVQAQVGEGHPGLRQPLHPAVGAQVRQQRRARLLLPDHDEALLRGVVAGPGLRQDRRGVLGQQEDVGLHDLVGRLGEGQDVERHPRVVRRDREVDRGPVARLQALPRGPGGVELGGHEDRAAPSVEVEDFGGVLGQREVVPLRPRHHLQGAALQDRDVEGADLLLQEDVRAAGGGGQRRLLLREDLGRLHLEQEPLEGPLAALLDPGGHPGQGDDGPELPGGPGELEGGDVVLNPLVVGGERGRPQQLHRAVGRHEPAAGEGGGGREEHGNGEHGE